MGLEPPDLLIEKQTYANKNQFATFLLFHDNKKIAGTT